MIYHYSYTFMHLTKKWKYYILYISPFLIFYTPKIYTYVVDFNYCCIEL